MKEKINVAELLKDCPRGMELDCIMWEDVTFDSILETSVYPIKIMTPDGSVNLTEYGSYSHSKKSKCVIFPKGKTTWDGFRKPFKDGDVVATSNGNMIAITEGGEINSFVPTYCILRFGKFEAYIEERDNWTFDRLATEEEKQQLFKAIEKNGYKWNAEKKCLEKLIEPKYKIGDRITNGKASIKIGYIDDNYYYEIGRNIASRISITEQEEWRLDKFDITTLKPFETKVLARDVDDEKWSPRIWGFYNKDAVYHPYHLIGDINRYCIPYEGNEHLLGKTDDCDEYYKIWED